MMRIYYFETLIPLISTPTNAANARIRIIPHAIDFLWMSAWSIARLTIN